MVVTTTINARNTKTKPIPNIVKVIAFITSLNPFEVFEIQKILTISLDIKKIDFLSFMYLMNIKLWKLL